MDNDSRKLVKYQSRNSIKSMCKIMHKSLLTFFNNTPQNTTPPHPKFIIRQIHTKFGPSSFSPHHPLTVHFLSPLTQQ